MPKFRLCKAFEVESGHMLSKHPERCRFPHGHSRRIEIVVSSEVLDANDMVLDFKALKLAVEGYVNRLDHTMALNSKDPAHVALEALHPGSTVVFPNQDPTTEVLARDLFEYTAEVLHRGFSTVSASGVHYEIHAGKVTLERVRVYETSSSWAEYGL